MDTVHDHLKRNYDLFIRYEQRLSFCRGLAGYLDYVLMTSPFKEVFEKEVAEYEKSHIELMRLEAKTLDEMIEAKDKLASIIKEKGLDVKTFSRLQTFSFTDSTDLFQEFDSFLQGKSVGNGFRSDSLQNYLFDLGANLLVKGYKEEIKQYLVTDEEYAKHYARINGSGGLLRTSMTKSIKNITTRFNY